MPTRNIVPRANEEGGLGTAAKKWLYGFIKTLAATTINALTLTAQTIGFTVAGGTTSKTLTVTENTALDEAVAMSGKAAKTHGALHLPNASDPIGLPKFSAHKNGTNQTGIVSVVWTKATFTTEEYDDGSAYDAPNSKWVPGVIGKAHIDVCIFWEVAVDQKEFIAAVYKNGSVYKRAGLRGSGINTISPLLSCDILVDAITDYFEIYVYQDSGGNQNITGISSLSWFMGHMLP